MSGRLVNPWTVRAVSLIVVLGTWEALGRAWANILFVPFSDVAAALVRLLGDAEFYGALRDSFAAFAIGLVAAIIAGIPVGALLGRVPELGRAGVHYTAFFLAVPMSALVPVVVVVAGIDLAARASIVFLFAFFEIVWNAYLGVRYADRAMVEMAVSYGASGRHLFIRVLLPGALPAILAGVRLGAGRAFIGMIAAELLLTSVGLGLLMMRFESRFEAAELFATVLLMLLIAAMLIGSLQITERRLLRRFAPASVGQRG